ncbi:Tyrosine aminotransferase [Sergentomyia squamirostris]
MSIVHRRSVKTYWSICPTKFAMKTCNPLRTITESLNLMPNPKKKLIPLSIGDPTVFGNLQACSEIQDAVVEAAASGLHNGYKPTLGWHEARQAVAKYSAHQGNVKPEDVILCNGCSSAVDMIISVLVHPGQNILCARPGYSIYGTISAGFDIELRHYNLLADENWEIDLDHLESLIDEKTAAVVITNPSNPCGSVFSRQHLEKVIAIAEKHFLPIIADEIYENIVFPGVEYTSVASLSENVPVLSCGGLSKRFLVPGWRLGWIIVHDRHDQLTEIRKGLTNLTGRLLGSNSLIQAALPAILSRTPQSFYDDLNCSLQKTAHMAYDLLRQIRGLNPVMPQGAMYMMVGIEMELFPCFHNEMEFVCALVEEQSVFCLPGECFKFPNFMRIVITVPAEVMREACQRIHEFCHQHSLLDKRIITNGI